MTDRLRIIHKNVASITTREKQHFFLRSVGKENEILNLVDTHSTHPVESSIRKKYPHLTMFFNHGPKMAVKKGCIQKKEYKKGTLTVFAPSLIKDATHTIIIPGMLSYIDFQIGEYPYRYVSVYAPSEAKEDKRAFEFFEEIFNKEVIDPDKYTIISGDWNSARTEMDHFNYKD